MKRKFLTMFLSGKAAVLPSFIGQAQAAVVPTFEQAISTTLAQIEVPTATVTEKNAVRLDSLGSATAPGQAYMCTNSGVAPDKLSLVVTGLKKGDMVFVVASPTPSTAFEAGLDARLKVNIQNGKVLTSSTIDGPADGTLTLSSNIDLAKLQAQGVVIASGTTLSLQTIVVPPSGISNGNVVWGNLRYSELDTITVGPCAVNLHGTSIVY